MNYKIWTTTDEAVIREAYRYGRRKGIIKDLCESLNVNPYQLRNHIRYMKLNNRL